MKVIVNFLDESGKIKQWPSKFAMKEAVAEYLSGKFEPCVDYSEDEVNQIIESWHTFGDYFLLRRALVDFGFLSRTANGAVYKKIDRDGKNS